MGDDSLGDTSGHSQSTVDKPSRRKSSGRTRSSLLRASPLLKAMSSRLDEGEADTRESNASERLQEKLKEIRRQRSFDEDDSVVQTSARTGTRRQVRDAYRSRDQEVQDAKWAIFREALQCMA